jgi:drug/metabolite transporter (DMT)-like permease
MWLVFALISPLFWAFVHVLDRHCVERVFDRPWMGVITSALSSILVIVAIPVAFPFAAWRVPTGEVIALGILAGVLIQISQGFYFQALEYTEAGIVAAYWNLTPTILPLASFVLLGKVLAGWHYVGIGVLVITSLGFCLVDGNLRGRWRSFWLMFAASLIQVAALLIEKRVFESGPFFVGFLFVTLGIILCGTAPLISRDVRGAFSANMASLKSAIPLIVLIELANLVALFFSQRAIDLGVPSLVAAVEATIPAYTFGLAVFLLLATKRFGDEQARAHLPIKLLLVAVMAVGVWLVSLEQWPSGSRAAPLNRTRAALSTDLP